MDWWLTFSRAMKWFLIFVFLIIFIFIISLSTGMIAISFHDILNTLIGNGTAKQELVLFQLRLPRMIMALLIGAGLALSGAILQGLSRNSLADPGILGINAGAGLTVVLCIYFLHGKYFTSPFFLPMFAFVGALTIAIIIYILSWQKGIEPNRLLLVGIGINALCGALLIIFQMKMDPRDFQKATIWLTGSIWGAQWKYVWALVPWIVILLPISFWQAKAMNIFQLGESVSIALGVHVERQRRFLLCISAALAGACVAVGGGISFVGLLAPHLARRLIGPNYYSLLPLSALIGATLLLVADMIGKNILAPADIPIGVVTSIIGSPYLIYMLLTRKNSGLQN
ncbi:MULTISPECIES: iron ABC transporter permease [Anoxybacillus]|uniref:Iron-uptake system permease protein FeuC n=1 Tax=Anoxybacillus ayderensis TaxID=265546 RepID=A0A0D0HUG6_9BACL|nr:MULTISPECIES: iron ABC transporter permease [Anoxybacillus]KIP21458.1 Iron-uptake system permease protein FeuC [Anoxybacillus ayderensis]NNU97012.1 iron ABC transporter permease [Anoxybacillus sp. EFIL]